MGFSLLLDYAEKQLTEFRLPEGKVQESVLMHNSRHLGNLGCTAPARTRSISPENFTGAKGQG